MWVFHHQGKEHSRIFVLSPRASRLEHRCRAWAVRNVTGSSSEFIRTVHLVLHHIISSFFYSTSLYSTQAIRSRKRTE